MSYTTLVTREVLARHLQDPEWVLFDCRFDLADPAAGQAKYARAHIPGARYAHLEAHLSGPKTSTSGRHPLPDSDKLATRLGAWGVDEHKQVVAYDDAGGAMAARLWWLLRWLGHRAVAVLDGGFGGWHDEQRPLTSAPPRIMPAEFTARPNAAAHVDSAFVERNLIDKRATVLDARARPRFLGELEPIDPVAGHVPHALNRPFDMNLNARGEFLPPAELEQSLQNSLRGAAPEKVIHMCGSGVTAAHNLLAMDVAGLAGSRLYAGSWSEWITDRGRPRAVGDDT
jgi:thiosulfate/3-mercaptopyruvate sulfurtransferase